MKKYLLLLSLIASSAFAQNISDYKYVLVPSKFLFLKEADQYNMNSLLKLFFQNQGFEAYFDKDTTAPDEFVKNNCNKIFVDLINNSNAFTTKIKVVIKDCKSNVLYISDEGTSREKEYDLAYNLALRMALRTMEGVRCKVTNSTVTPVVIEQPKPEKKTVVTPAPTGIITVKKTIIGYDVLDSNSKLLYSLSKTSVKDIYIAKKDTIQGIVYQAEGHWFFEHYQGNTLLTEVLNIELK